MANLLTDEIKKDLQRDTLNRRLIAVSLAIMFLLLITLFILGALGANLLVMKRGLSSLLSVVSGETKAVKISNDSISFLKKLESEAEMIDGFWSETTFSSLIKESIGLKTNDLKITSLVIERGELKQPLKMSLIGLADSRNALIDYVNILRRENFFLRVNLPVESLISDRGGQFVISLEK